MKFNKTPLTMKKRFLYGLIVLVLCTASSFFYFYYQTDSNKLSAVKTPCPVNSFDLRAQMDMDILRRPPKIKWVNRESSIKSIYYDGLPYKGDKTIVFAYYATPGSITGDESKDHNLPAIVLVHGGYGAASQEFVSVWAHRGYAAISMDLDGNGPDHLRLQNGGPPAHQYMDYDWNYHAVAKIILAHSLMLGFDEVDPNRTVLAGVSVGGHLTLIVAGIDCRFKAAASVFGCGYLYKRGCFKKWYQTRLSSEEQVRWRKSIDPSNYLGCITIPFLFATRTDDEYYPLDILSDTYNSLHGPFYLLIDPLMEHGPKSIELKILKSFFDQYLMNGKHLPTIEQPEIKNNQVYARVPDVNFQNKAMLVFTKDKKSSAKRIWHVAVATIDQSGISAELPTDMVIGYFLYFYDWLVDEKASIASPILFVE